MAEKEFVTPGEGKRLSEKNLEYLRQMELRVAYDELGIEVSNGGVGEVPVSNGVPRIFLVKDGKVSTLTENNMKLGSEAYYNAMLNGHVFAYPPGAPLLRLPSGRRDRGGLCQRRRRQEDTHLAIGAAAGGKRRRPAV